MHLIDNTIQLYADAVETIKRKNADYTGGNTEDGLENFKLCSQMTKLSMSKGILVRLSDKMVRISNLLNTEKDAQVKDETIYDTIQDAINYLAILSYALQQEKRKIKKK